MEDDEPTRQLLDAILRRGGYRTTAAVNGDEAIEILRRESFDLVILDLMMPHAAGGTVIEYLRAQARRPPVIVCTAAGPSSTATLPASIVGAIVRKPFDITELVRTIERLAGQSQAMPLSTVLVVDDDDTARYVLRAFAQPARVVEAPTAEEALRLIDERHPDVILLDLVLPGMRGEDMLRALKQNPATAGIPVIIVTSRKLTEAEQQMLLTYGAGYIYKGDLSRETLQRMLEVVRIG